MMYEHMSQSVILQRMLDRVPDTIDKREGSIIYDACAPAAAELAQMYVGLDLNRELSFADTANGEFLTRRTEEFGVNRRLATHALRRAFFYGTDNGLIDVPIGNRFAISGVVYTVQARESLGRFVLMSDQAGLIGNQNFGTLLPVDYVTGLVRAEIADVLVPGEDEETDASLRERYYQTVNEPAFGGNVSDYRHKIGAIDGVGSVKVYPVWQGGGTVRCVIIAADWTVPSLTLVNQVQTIIDPEVNSGQGLGLAPIGHQVTIDGVTDLVVDVDTTLTLASGVTSGQVQSDVEAVISAYLLELRKEWGNQQQLVVRTAQLDARLLNVEGIVDIMDTKINNIPANLMLGADVIPVMGSVIIHE